MQITALPVGALRTNCYILDDENGCAAVVDPGDDADRIIQYVRMHDLAVKEIWLTHGHFDHIQAVAALKKAFSCRVIACRVEQTLLADPHLNLSTMFSGVPITVEADELYDDGDTFFFGGKTVMVLHTPGHTSGSCCYEMGDVLISGDTLFKNSIGRTDLPTGDTAALRLSLQRLAALEGNMIVYPGHGPTTTLEEERLNNPYLS